MSSEIQVFDFYHNKFAGDQRQAHQFIPYVYGKISAKGIQWILNEKKFPTPMVNPLTITAALADERMQEKFSMDYRQNQESFTDDLAQWEHAKDCIIRDPANCADHTKLVLELGVHELLKPVEPVLVMPADTDFKCKPSDHIKMDKISEKKLKFISVAAEAIQIILEYLSVDMKTSLADILGNQDIDERTKLVNIWEWLETFRVDNPSIIGEVQQDMQNLSQIDSFADAILRVKDMNILQHELKVLGQPYTDRELIVIHAGKLRGDVFKEVNYKWLQKSTRPTHSKPSLSRTTQPAVVSTASLTWSWDDYCDDISRYHNTDNTVRTKSTVLLSKAVSESQVYSVNADAEIESKVLALYHQRYGPTPPSHHFQRNDSRSQPYQRGSPTLRAGRWHHNRRENQIPANNSPYASQFTDVPEAQFRSQVPQQSPFRSQVPYSPLKKSSTSGYSDHLPPRDAPGRGRGHFNSKRKFQAFQSSPIKRAYTAYVENFQTGQALDMSAPMDSYEDFVCKNSMVYSATCFENSIDSPQQSAQDARSDYNSVAEQITYWDEIPQEEEEDASVFFMSMGAK